DLDLVVEFDPPVGMSLADQYFDLLEELQQVFGRRVDLVERSAIKNSRFAAALEKSQQLLYAA
ncbi:MAG: hypothetical protein M3R13_05710, partial [Armatimonadota bacterium]|nr:hypothetical protein [Armatimonadota bacterium]